MACFLEGGPEKLQKRRDAWDRVETTLDCKDTWKLPSIYGEQTRSEQFDEGLKAGRVMFEDGMKYGHKLFDEMTWKYQLGNALPFGITTVIFLPAIKYLGSDEQYAEWEAKSRRGEIIGAYVSTELGGGTFVRGFETTATYDRISQEFVLNSPTLESIKFWPGSLGYSATHCVVMARLIVGNKDFGIHPFVMKIRSLEDNKALFGIELGDIGLKYSYNQTDNGYMRFENVRVPRSALLNRHAHVLADGTYVPAKSHTDMYTTMIYVRNVIVNIMAYQLAQAVTIGTRYSIVREQGNGPNGALDSEVPIYHYKTQHFRLLTMIANTYAIKFASRALDRNLQDHAARVLKSDQSRAQCVHVACAGYKAWSTVLAADGTEDCRKLCGGHGFLAISGLGEITTAGQTLEGENFVLWQQVYRFLLKCVRALEAGQQIGGDLSYLANGFKFYHIPATSFDRSPAATEQNIEEILNASEIEPVLRPKSACFVSIPDAFTNPGGFIAMTATMSDPSTSPYHEWLQEKAAEVLRNARPPPEQKSQAVKPLMLPKCQAFDKDFLKPEVQLAIYRHRALRLVYTTAESLTKARASGMTEAESWNKYMLCIVDAARAHTEYNILSDIQESLVTIPTEYQNLRPVLTRLMSLYALSTIINPASPAAITWAEDGYLSYSQLNDIRENVHDLLGELYYEAVGLTDAWDFSDASLCSAIGCYDGNVYERMMSWVRQLPINVKAREEGQVYKRGWEESLKPFLMERRIKAKL
ncbi:acyl-CoA oxidase [Venturia nashicola]|nr:acyl-CoA oxidase [Venturia nashicola]